MFWKLITLKSTQLAVTSEILSDLRKQCQVGLEISRDKDFFVNVCMTINILGIS